MRAPRSVQSDRPETTNTYAAIVIVSYRARSTATAANRAKDIAATFARRRSAGTAASLWKAPGKTQKWGEPDGPPHKLPSLLLCAGTAGLFPMHRLRFRHLQVQTRARQEALFR